MKNQYMKSSGKEHHHRNPWITALKVTAWVVGSLVVLAGIAFWIISYHLSPAYITKLIEEKSDEYLDAEIKIGKLDYKLYSTYPWLYFEVDSLYVISKSLDSLSPQEKSGLPTYADSLASVIKLSGKINVHDLIHEKLRLKELKIEKPSMTIVMVNDSLANFNIAKKPVHASKMPSIDLTDVDMEAPLKFNYFSLCDSIAADATVENFSLVRNDDKSYTVGFDGLIGGYFGMFSLPGEIPVKFNTTITPKFPEIALNLKHLALSVYNVNFEAEGDMSISAKEVNVDKADVKFEVADVFGLINSLPEVWKEQIFIPEGISGNLPLRVNASVLSPWTLTASDVKSFNTDSINLNLLPPLNASINISEANLILHPKGFKKVEADDIVLDLEGYFNPTDSLGNFVRVNEISLRGEGLDFSANALLPLTPEEQDFSTALSLESTVMETLNYFMPGTSMKISGRLKGKCIAKGKLINYGKDGIKDITITGDLLSGNLGVTMPSAKVNLKNTESDFKAFVPEYPLSDYKGTKADFLFKAEKISAVSNGTNIDISNLKVDLNAMDTVSGNPDPNGDLHVTAGSILAKSGATNVSLNQIDFTAVGALNSAGGAGSNYTVVNPTSPGEDALIASRVKHTPLVVEYNGGGILSTIMGMVNLDAQVNIGNGAFSSPAYLYPVDFKGIQLSTNLNHCNLFASNVTIANSGFELSGEVDGLMPFLTSYSATPLKASADINFLNVDINTLSLGYYGALIKQGISPDSAYFVSPLLPYSAGDSVCVAIPRNIDANIRLKANSAEYMQYRFSPLSTSIIVKDGSATLSKLTVGAPYCTAVVDWTYSTSSLNNIVMDLNADVKNFSFEPFYKVFPMLVDKAPELVNFTGTLNSQIHCRFLMYPDMFMNPQSLTGRFDISGTDLQFARQGKIEKITHLMLIEGDEPIKLQNLHITGAYHDNLLQVNPFKVAFGDYQLQFAGVNNTSGKMYYHLALEKSPFHLPFGVSVFGDMKHPEIRLGGTHIDDYRSEMVATDESDKINANIMAWLHHGWLLFVTEAAKYKGENEQ